MSEPVTTDTATTAKAGVDVAADGSIESRSGVRVR